jgi:plasmid stabilization system protein ParE
MAKPVLLTEIAEQDLEFITDYLAENWGIGVSETFLIHFEKTCDNISLNPRMYRKIYHRGNVRKCILTKQNTIYYRERRNKIEILTIFDTRRNPDNIQGIITQALK